MPDRTAGTAGGAPRVWGDFVKLLMAALTAAVVLVAGPVATPARGDAGRPAERGWIVTMVAGADPGTEAPRLARSYGGRVGHVYANVVGGFSFHGSEQAAAALARNPRVERVDPSLPLHLTELAPNGILRISAWAAHQAGYAGTTSGGTKIRIAVVDSGIRTSHSDLAPNVATGEGKNCVGSGPPDDDHGHGTHVAGTAAAAYNGGDGVVGVATDASLVAIKVVDAGGTGSDEQVICGIDHAVALAQATGTRTVVNLSLGEARAEGTGCASAPLHQAVCDAVAAGVTVVAAAGNSASDAASFYPAAYPEAIAVSALTDFDGARSFAGCEWEDTAGWECDDHLADFSNYGSVVDVAAPGVRVYSSDIGGGWSIKSGTSMAAPHVAGAAALLLGANPTLTPADVRSRLMSTGECPDGTVASPSGSCSGHGQWTVGSMFGNYPDPDGIAEPLVHALRAAQAAGTPGPDTTPPTVTVNAPTEGARVRGTVTVTATAGDDRGVSVVEFHDGETLIGTDSTAPYQTSWNTAATADGPHVISATARDAAGHETADANAVTVDNTAPTVTVTSPASGATVSGVVTINATATDPAGVAKVEFLVDGVVKQVDTSAGYAAAWDSTTAANGSHTLAARATDALGNVATSAPVTVTVDNAGTAITTHVASLTASSVAARRSWTAMVTVGVANQDGAAVGGATVTFALSGGANGSVTCTTGDGGSCSASVSVSSRKKRVTFTVTGISAPGTAYDAAQNVASAATSFRP